MNLILFFSRIEKKSIHDGELKSILFIYCYFYNELKIAHSTNGNKDRE